MVLLFRQDRASLIAKNFTDAKLEQIESLRSTLAKMPLEERADRPDRPGGRMFPLQKLGREYGIMLIPTDRRPEIGQVPRGPALAPLVEKLQEHLGADTEIRLGMRVDQPVVWIRMKVGEDGARSVWAGIPIRNVEAGEVPTRLLVTLGIILVALLAATYWLSLIHI